MSIKIGQSAPSFELFNTEKNKVSLESKRGRNVLLLFFPLAFSSVCTKELCNVRDDLSKYEALNAEVLGISVDSLYALGRFKQDHGLNFALLSDFNKNVSAAYGCLYEKFSYGMNGVSKRAAFLIDKDGIIRYAEVLENAAEVPNFAKIAETLEALPASSR